MNRQRVLKIIVDIAMTAALLLLMAFELVGRQAHEWSGIVMFVLFVIHHILNRKWTSSERKISTHPHPSDASGSTDSDLYDVFYGQRDRAVGVCI